MAEAISIRSAGRNAGCVLLLLCALQIVVGPYARLGKWRVLAEENGGWLEARAWLNGRTDVGVHLDDFAMHRGKWFNVNPPLFTFLSVGALWLQRMMQGGAADLNGFYPAWYVMVVALPLPLLAYWAFRAVLKEAGVAEERGPGWAAFLAFAYVAGTALQPTLAVCQQGSVNWIDHALSQAGLLLIAGDVLGRRRWWPVAVGLVIAAWSRQMTIFYAIPLLVYAVMGERTRRAVASVLIGAGIATAGLMTVNYVRFGNPLDSGYAKIYTTRTDEHDWMAARERAHGVFSTAFLWDNFRCMNLAVPSWEIAGGVVRPVYDERGTCIWFTTPLLLMVLWDWRAWWGDARRRALMIGSGLIIAGLMLYHTTGQNQSGYYRYSLDYVPIWLAVIAPGLVATRQRAAVTIGCTAWSTLYYTLIA